MTDPLKAFLQASSLEAAPFAPASRYHGLPTLRWTRLDGQEVSYVTRRFIPPPENLATLREHLVSEGDRLDNLAGRYLGDPEQYWRLCDANGAMRPDDLVDAIGARIRIALPEGIPGGQDA